VYNYHLDRHQGELMQLDKIEGNIVAVKGNIKTIGDYQELKGYVQKLIDNEHKEVEIHILDSYTITSSVVGYMFKIINLEMVKITLHVRDHRLYQILEDLRLLEAFNVQKL
jgi:uncharacterized protein YjbJ (UPF0337 family)